MTKPIVVCGPGKYYGDTATTWSLCRILFNHPRRGCLPCPGNKVKAVTGNSLSLCLDACDMTTNVPNSDRSGCGEFCKISRGEGSRYWRTNVTYNNYLLLFFPVCSPGYFKDGDVCSPCTGDTVKTSAGNATSCDTTCDGIATVANADNTGCGMAYFYNSVYKYSSMTIFLKLHLRDH